MSRDLGKQAILDAVRGVLPAIAASVDSRFDTVFDPQIAGHRLSGQH